jgi:hypothetical protein
MKKKEMTTHFEAGKNRNIHAIKIELIGKNL